MPYGDFTSRYRQWQLFLRRVRPSSDMRTKIDQKNIKMRFYGFGTDLSYDAKYEL
jgi:hypothetical protein